MSQTMPGKIVFLLIDDHTLIRSALSSLLRQTYDNAIIEEMSDGTHIVERLAVASYDLIVLDIQMPGTEAISLVKHITLTYPATPVLIYSSSAENIYALRMLKAGAKGFVSKDASVDELKRAIAITLQGNRYLSQNVAEQISQRSIKIATTPFSILSVREVQIATMFLAGNSGSQISIMLRLKNSTVSTHKTRIYKKLKVSSLLGLKEISDAYNF